MKKSKIIAPALGVLILSTAAAVTGTVAWFTASRIATISNTAITAYNPESGLKVNLSGAKACTIDTAEGTGNTAAAVSHAYLRDASVDIVNGKVFRSVFNDDGSAKNNEFREVTTAALAGTAAGTITSSSLPYYYCSIYTATFSLANPTSDSYTLAYDNTKLETTNEQNLAIAPALRIGIFVDSSHYAVVAPFEAAGSKSYVTAANAAPSATYTALGMDKLGSVDLGTLTGAGTVVATVYTWFEGLDAACISDNVNTTRIVTAALGFKITLQNS